MPDDLAADLRHLLQDDAAIARLGGLDPDAIKSEADALAAALAGLVPDRPARAEVRTLAIQVFSDDAPREAAMDDLRATAERDVGNSVNPGAKWVGEPVE